MLVRTRHVTAAKKGTLFSGCQEQKHAFYYTCMRGDIWHTNDVPSTRSVQHKRVAIIAGRKKERQVRYGGRLDGVEFRHNEKRASDIITHDIRLLSYW